MKSEEFNLNRRDFIGTFMAGGAALTAYARLAPKQLIQPGPDRAPDGPALKAGLIGCGGRGTGAAVNFIDAGPNLQIAALADVFQDRLDQARSAINKERGQEVPSSHCFVGFDAYKKLIDSGVDIVLCCTPPHFRPEHFAAAVEARKHVFLEKPIAVDPVGVRSVIATAERAKALGLCVMTGTQIRRDKARIEAYNRVTDGAIGEVEAIRCFRNQGALWYKERQPGWSDMEYMIRDWVNWTWLSGDHIVEQHIHEIDQCLWFTGTHPVRAMGMGGRMRRVTGDQYDFFSIDYAFENGVHMHSMTRQINGCAHVRVQYLVGNKGDCRLDEGAAILDKAGKVIWQYQGPKTNTVVQEHVDFVTAIRTGKSLNTANDTAVSTLVAIMGRESAYTGKEVAWGEMMESSMRLGPTEYAMGPVSIKARIPVPGEGGVPSYAG